MIEILANGLRPEPCELGAAMLVQVAIAGGQVIAEVWVVVGVELKHGYQPFNDGILSGQRGLLLVGERVALGLVLFHGSTHD